MQSERSPVHDGLVIGLIAYASVALFYAGFDFLAARGPLYTVDLLGKAVFRGLRDPSVLQQHIDPDQAAIFWYNGLHLVLSLAIGQVVAHLVQRADARPKQGRLMLGVMVLGFVVTVLAVGFLTASMRPLLPWWSIVVANGLAVVVAGSYLARRHPGLTRHLIHAS